MHVESIIETYDTGKNHSDRFWYFFSTLISKILVFKSVLFWPFTWSLLFALPALHILQCVSLDYGMEDENPLNHVCFYMNNDVPIRCSKDEVWIKMIIFNCLFHIQIILDKYNSYKISQYHSFFVNTRFSLYFLNPPERNCDSSVREKTKQVLNKLKQPLII